MSEHLVGQAEIEAAVAGLVRQREAARVAPQEFACECSRPDCDEVVLLSSEQYEALRVRRDLVLAPGHEETRAQRARRLAGALREDAQGLCAQARTQIDRARRGPGTPQ